MEYKGTHKYDAKKNRIISTVVGMMTMKDTDAFISEGKKAVDLAKPGFTIVIDYGQADPSPADVNDKLGELRGYLASKGPKAVATVVNKLLLKGLMNQKLKGQNIDPTTFGSVAEAEAYLDAQ